MKAVGVNTKPLKNMSPAHYYGDKVRTLLISAAVIMVLTMPFFSELIPKPAYFATKSVRGLTSEL